MTTLLADYEKERQAFEALLQFGCNKHVLLFEGQTGSGKTTLLEYCLEHIPESMPHVSIQLRGNAVGMAEVFSRSGKALNWEYLPNFTAQVADLQNIPKVQIDRNWLAGIRNQINVVLNVQDLTDREQRRTALTEAWFSDLDAFDQPVLLMFDTYEQATTEVKDWISGPLLARTAYAGQVRVLVAGREVPNKHNIEWGHCCVHHPLYGVREARHWLPVVQAMRRHIPLDDPLTWLAGVCYALKGNPAEIMKIIEGLPLLELQA
jgi:hypothetical protein